MNRWTKVVRLLFAVVLVIVIAPDLDLRPGTVPHRQTESPSGCVQCYHPANIALPGAKFREFSGVNWFASFSDFATSLIDLNCTRLY